MRIAIIGTGISGLTAAHLLHPEHEIVVYEAGDHVGGHANTIRVDTDDATWDVDTGFIVLNDRNYPRFEALLDEIGVARQPTNMSFSVSAEDEDFEYSSGGVRGLLAQPSNLARPRFARMVADYVRFNRVARALLDDAGDERSLGAFLADEDFSPWFVERLLVPQAAAVWSADPEQMWSFPARFLVAFFAHHGMLSLTGRPQWATIVGGSARYVEALTAPFADRIRVRTPIAAVTRHPTHVDVVPEGEGAEEFDEVVIAAHADQALALLTDPSATGGRGPRRLPLPAQRGGPAHRSRPAPAPTRGMGGVELSPARPATRPLRGDLLHEPSAVPRRRPAVLRDAQPHGRDRARARHPRHPLRAPGLHARGDGGAGPTRGDQRRVAHALLRRLLAMGLSRGRRRQRAPRGGAHARAGARLNALYEGWVGHRRLQPVDHSFRYRVFMAYLDLDAVPESLGPAWLWSTSHPALVRFRRSDYLGDPDIPLADAIRALVAERTGTRPGGPVRLLTNLRCLGHLFNPVSFYYCFDRTGEGLEAVVAEVTNTPWGERHAYVLGARAEDGAVHERVDKVFHVSPFMAMDHEYELCLSPPGRRVSVEIVSRKDGEVHFDASLKLDRGPLDAPGLRRVLRRQPVPTLAVVSRIYANAVRLKLKGAPYFGHPREAPR